MWERQLFGGFRLLYDLSSLAHQVLPDVEKRERRILGERGSGSGCTGLQRHRQLGLAQERVDAVARILRHEHWGASEQQAGQEESCDRSEWGKTLALDLA